MTRNQEKISPIWHEDIETTEEQNYRRGREADTHT
jgi:hypothetical protein